MARTSFVEIVDAAGHQDDVERRKSRLELRHQLEAIEIRIRMSRIAGSGRNSPATASASRASRVPIT